MSKLTAISQYIRNVQIRNNATMRLCADGSEVYLYKGAVIPSEQFNELFPIHISLRGNYKDRDNIIDKRARLFY